MHDVRLEKWVNAIPAVDVTVTARPQGADRWAVAFGPYARATVHLAPAYPAPPSAPPLDAADERSPDIVAAQLYEDRWMFHGPAFRGVTALRGDRRPATSGARSPRRPRRAPSSTTWANSSATG